MGQGAGAAVPVFRERGIIPRRLLCMAHQDNCCYRIKPTAIAQYEDDDQAGDNGRIGVDFFHKHIIRQNRLNINRNDGG